jgi:hypothetical protein
MVVVAIIIGVGIGLVVAVGTVSIVASWLGDRKGCRIHREALARCSSDEVRARAIGWLSDPEWQESDWKYPEWKESATLNELRALLETGNYRLILKRWRRFHAAIVGASNWDPKEGPSRTWILRDYVTVLDARAASPRP